MSLDNFHLHSKGRETKSHLEFGFKFFPKGYKPLYPRARLPVGNGIDIDMKPNEAGQQLHAYGVLPEHTKIISFEPHMHAPGVRMCLEAIWGHNIQTLNCVGYDHSWVRGYVYADGAASASHKGWPTGPPVRESGTMARSRVIRDGRIRAAAPPRRTGGARVYDERAKGFERFEEFEAFEKDPNAMTRAMRLKAALAAEANHRPSQEVYSGLKREAVRELL